MLSFARGIVSFSKSFMFSSYVSFQTTLAFASLEAVLTFDVVLLDLEYKCLFWVLQDSEETSNQKFLRGLN